VVLAEELRRAGVEHGDRVLLHMGNRPELLAWYYACFWVGAIACPTNIRLTARELTRVVEALSPRAHVGDTAGAEACGRLEQTVLRGVARLEAQTPLTPEAFGVRPTSSEPSLLGAASDTSASLDDIAVLFSTSGTTGEPKFVAHTARTLGETARLLGDEVVQPAGPTLLLPHWVHAFGCYSWLGHVRHRYPVVGLGSFSPDAALAAIGNHECVLVVGLPHMCAALVAAQRGRRPSPVEVLLTSGDAPSSGLQRLLEETWSVPLRQFWASSGVQQSGVRQALVRGVA
jgi:acyl-CoA synthetase (AMP-forming)/AMP-acid ligase II